MLWVVVVILLIGFIGHNNLFLPRIFFFIYFRLLFSTLPAADDNQQHLSIYLHHRAPPLEMKNGLAFKRFIMLTEERTKRNI